MVGVGRDKGRGGGCRRPRRLSLLVMLVLIATGMIPERSSALKCYSCDGGPACQDPDVSLIRACDDPWARFCFKSGGPLEMIRGCAPKALLDFALKNVKKGDLNCFDCSGAHITTGMKMACEHFGEALLLKPQLISLPPVGSEGVTSLCQGDICNDGGPAEVKLIIGNWEGGRCARRSFAHVMGFHLALGMVKKTPVIANWLEEEVKPLCTGGGGPPAPKPVSKLEGVTVTCSCTCKYEMGDVVLRISILAFVLAIAMVWLFIEFNRHYMVYNY